MKKLWLATALLLGSSCFIQAPRVYADTATIAAQLQASNRHVALDGVYNLRDLGGYQTEDGQRVRWGMLYRSSDLTDISVSDRTTLEGLGINTICDLRSDRERELRADPPLTRWQFDTRCHTAGAALKLPEKSGDQQPDWRALFTQFYRGLGKQYAPQYRALFDDLKQQKTPLLLHCTAGKDRTGVGSALILLALGVPQDTVIADYHLTEQFEAGAPASIMSNYPELARIPALKEAHPAYLQAALDGIAQDYGSLDNYFTQELGVSAQDRQQLRAQLLEPAVKQ